MLIKTEKFNPISANRSSASLFNSGFIRAEYWVNNYGTDYQVTLLNTFNIDYYNTLSNIEQTWLQNTITLLDNNYETTNDLQTALYDVVKETLHDESELKQQQKRYFQILYNMLLGTDQGPKLGLFLMALNKDKLKELLCNK